MYFVSVKQCIVFIVVFLISRLCFLLFDIRRRRTAVTKNLLDMKRDCVRTLIVLGSGMSDFYVLSDSIIDMVTVKSLLSMP